jgi:hypothetical protein
LVRLPDASASRDHGIYAYTASMFGDFMRR